VLLSATGYGVRQRSMRCEGEMTTIYEFRRWEISLDRYMTHKGTAGGKLIRGKIIPGTAKKSIHLWSMMKVDI
jgi:hypothetical protein